MAKVCTGWTSAVVCAFALAPGYSAPAATRTAPFQVSAHVEPSCHVQSPLSVAQTLAGRELVDRIRVRCSPCVAHAISIEAAAAHTGQARTHPRLVVIVTY